MMNAKGDSMIEYYARRAAEYERVYSKPERQVDLQTLKEFLGGVFACERVLEIACGTGYWTQFMAKSATAILATDFNSDVIDLARQKVFGACRVHFTEADAYSLDTVSGDYTAGFHGFWWSHLPKNKMRLFLSAFHSKLPTGAKVVMIDNQYVNGSSSPISRHDADGNTYQLRRLDDGSEHEVLKNFPSDEDIISSLAGFATEIGVRRLHYFWIAEYTTKEMPNTGFNLMNGR